MIQNWALGAIRSQKPGTINTGSVFNIPNYLDEFKHAFQSLSTAFLGNPVDLKIALSSNPSDLFKSIYCATIFIDKSFFDIIAADAFIPVALQIVESNFAQQNFWDFVKFFTAFLSKSEVIWTRELVSFIYNIPSTLIKSQQFLEYVGLDHETVDPSKVNWIAYLVMNIPATLQLDPIDSFVSCLIANATAWAPKPKAQIFGRILTPALVKLLQRREVALDGLQNVITSLFKEGFGNLFINWVADLIRQSYSAFDPTPGATSSILDIERYGVILSLAMKYAPVHLGKKLIDVYPTVCPFNKFENPDLHGRFDTLRALYGNVLELIATQNHEKEVLQASCANVLSLVLSADVEIRKLGEALILKGTGCST